MTDSAPAWWQIAEPESVWRVCQWLKMGSDEDGCQHCPQEEDVYGERTCTRGCYMMGVELINIVKTGNPWRKTEGIKPPWTVLAPAEKD